QPRAGQDPGRVARIDAGGAGDHRGSSLRAAGTVHGGGHAEPDRAGGNLPAARGAAGPLPDQGGDRLSGVGGRAAHGRARDRRQGCRRPRRVAGAAGAEPGAVAGGAAGGGVDPHGCRGHRLRGAHCAHHARMAGRDRRRRSARRPGAGAAGARAGSGRRPRFRHPGRRARSGVAGLAPSPAAGAGGAARTPAPRRRAQGAAAQGAGTATVMRPAPALLWLLLGWTVLGVLASLGWLPLAAWLAGGGALALLALVDGWRLRRMPSPEVSRELAPVLPLGPEARIGLRVRGTTRRAQKLRLHDLHPGGWAVRGMPRTLLLPAGGDVRLEYAVTPDARGQFAFDGCHVQLHSPWRCWSVRRVLGAASTVRVYPNFAALVELAGLSVELASRSVGARLQRRRGEGTEFQELRDYRVERNQQVVLMLDCGRRLLAQDDRRVHFDHVLNASLALASIALRQGDAVGLLACTGQQQR